MENVSVFFFAIMRKVKNTFRMTVAIFYEMKCVSFFLAITILLESVAFNLSQFESVLLD